MIAVERLREALSYDAETGVLTWKINRRAARRAGDVAGSIGMIGYRKIEIDGRCYLAHRVIWAMMTGKWPVDQIDHINGDRADNRFANLREATPHQNQGNRLPTKGKTLPTGVFFYKNDGKYGAAITMCGRDKRSKYLGIFSTPEEAAEAYRAAAVNYFGEFANGN